MSIAAPASLQRRFDALRNLEQDWNGYDEPAPNHRSIYWSQVAANLAIREGLEPEIVPDAMGGVFIGFGSGRKRADITIDNDGDLIVTESVARSGRRTFVDSCVVELSSDGLLGAIRRIKRYLEAGL